MREDLHPIFPPFVSYKHDCDVPLRRYSYCAVQDYYSANTYHLFVYRKYSRKTKRVFFKSLRIYSNPADWSIVPFIYESEFDDYLFIVLSDSRFYMLKNIDGDKFFVYKMPVRMDADIITVEEPYGGTFIFNCRTLGNAFELTVEAKADMPCVVLSMSAEIMVEPNISFVSQYAHHPADAYFEKRKGEMKEWLNCYKIGDY